MFECFGIFSKVKAFDCNDLGLAAARTMLFPLHHASGADSSIRANGEESASRAEFANPLSRPQIKHRLGFSLPSESGRLGAQVSCGVTEPRNLSHIHSAAGTQRGQTDRPGAEFVAADRLLARLTLHQVRPNHRSIVGAGEKSCSACDPIGCLSISVPSVRSPFNMRSGPAVGIVHTASPDALLAPIETLFTELAGRCLRNLAAEEISE
jgi:hypothetical protein